MWDEALVVLLDERLLRGRPPYIEVDDYEVDLVPVFVVEINGAPRLPLASRTTTCGMNPW